MPTPPQSRRGFPLREATLALVALIVSVGVVETLARVFWHPPPPQAIVGSRRFTEWLTQLSLGPASADRLYRDDPERLWSLVPGARIESINPHYNPDGGERQPIRISINAEGYRGPLAALRKQESTFRVLCLGDSNFFGYPLDDEDTFPSALARSLDRGRPSSRIEVVNAGVPGYTVLQGALWYDRQFRRHETDWVLLSYLNNDAWPQPRSDADLIARQRGIPPWLMRLGGSSRAVQWAQSLLEAHPAQSPLAPRLSLDEFIREYRSLIRSAQGNGAHVLILDYRAYEEYEPYSRALAHLAREMRVGYFPVSERVFSAIGSGTGVDRPESPRVRRRWGSLLEKRPSLRLYAEYYPEHLNEAGTAWLADQIAPLLLAVDE